MGNDSRIDEMEAELSTTDQGWLGGFVESFLESTEETLSAAAASIREGVSETVQTVASTVAQSDFYKNNMVYVPPEEAQATKDANSSSSTASAIPVSEEDSQYRTSGFFSIEEDLLAQVDSAPLEDRIQAARQSIGYLKVKISEGRRLSVDGSRMLGTTHPYLTIRLGRYQLWVSPVAKENTEKAGNFMFNREITLVAQDVNTDLVVEVRQKNVLLADSLIGQVLVPLTSIIPDVRTALSGKHKRCEPYTLCGWFELFPLQEGRRKFRPASHDIANTGMWKKTPPLGYIHLNLELHLHGRISMWAGYAMPASEHFMDVPKNPVPTGDLKAISAVVETGRGFKRNFQRVKVAFNRLFSRGQYAWAPFRLLRKARNLENLRVTGFVLAVATFACLIAPPYLLPLNIYAVILVSALSGFDSREKHEYLVWNQDIRDPDDELGSIQKVAKLIYLLEKFERWMGVAADWMERAIHVFTFADERVTFAALLSLGVCATGLTFALFFVSPGYLFFLAFLSWFCKPTLQKITAVRKRIKQKEKQKANGKASSEVVLSPNDEESLRGHGKLAQAIAVGKLMAKTPSLAMNVFARVPTEDELGHRWISKLQRLSGEPPEDDEEDGISANGGVAPAEIWLREL